MSVSLYRCEFVNALTLTKDITRISIVKDDPDFLFSQSCIVCVGLQRDTYKNN